MKKSIVLLFLSLLAFSPTLWAQVTSEPSPLLEDSENVIIYFHADQGNKGLINQPSTAGIYAHTGVITTASVSDSDWKYAPKWGDNAEKYKLEYVSPNLWKLNIGNIRSFYGITNPDEYVKSLAFVFRNADNTKEGKAENNKDIFIDVIANKLLVELSSSMTGPVVLPGQETVKFTLTSNHAAALELFVNGTSIGKADNTTVLSADYTFPAQGESYTVRGTARTADQNAEVEENIFFPVPASNAEYPGGTPRMGTVRQDDGSVLFCLAAPQKNNVLLLGSWSGFAGDQYSPMNYQDYEGNRYFWTKVNGLEADELYTYYYLVDGSAKVGDPYARLVLDPYNDSYISAEVYPDLPPYPFDKVKDVPLAVYQENINSYDWKVKDFKGVEPHNLVIYEMLLRDFTGTEGKADGNGTVRKAIARIPYLKRLGVNAIELLPINEFNGNISWGYNPNFYFAPDKAYGTPDDYKEFIDLCHQNGIAVILDIVFNQTDWLHPWYQMYPSGSNPFFNASAPHAYSVLNDWNQGNPIVQQQFKDVLKYWIEEYKVDGYRFDLVKGLGDNDSYPNNGDSGTNQYNASRVQRMKELQAAIKEVKEDAYFINENLAGAQEENEMAAFGQLNWANLNTQGQNYAAGTSSNSALNRFYAPKDSRTWGSTVSYLESHDEQRLAYVQDSRGISGVKGNLDASMARLASAAAQMLLSPGAHMIWQFSELGNYDNTKNNTGGNNTDPKTVRWNLYDEPARRGLYDSYRELIAVRTNNPQLFSEQAEVTMNCSDANWNEGRSVILKNGNDEVYLIVNPTTAQKPVKVTFTKQDTDAYHILTKGYNTNPSFNAATGTVIVPANSYVVIGTKNLAGIDGTGVDTATADGVIAWSEPGCICLAEETDVTICDLSGVCVFRGNGNVRINVNPGIYIVRAGSRTAKLLVR